MRRYRSFLFMPGHKKDWIVRADRFNADALILDLEDSVPIDLKPMARAVVSEVLAEADRAGAHLWVRLNGWRTGQMVEDLSAVVRPGLVGVAPAKTTGPDDIRALDLLLSDFEESRGLPVGGIAIMPHPESAHAMLRGYEVLAASPRCTVAAGPAGSAPGGDYYRALGCEWTREGTENVYSNAKAVMDARAAGVSDIILGPVTQVDDLDHVRAVMRRARIIGVTGAMVIHPSHVALANEIFGITAQEIEEAKGIVVAMAEAIANGSAAVRHKGGMVDYAMVRTSYDVLAQAEADGIDVGSYPRIDVLSL